MAIGPNNPFGNISHEDQMEIIDRVLGAYDAETLSDQDAKELWDEHLSYARSIEEHNSLHIVESVYMHEGTRYSCCWALGDDDVIPMIQRMNPRKRYQRPTNEPLQWALALAKVEVPEMHGCTFDFTNNSDAGILLKFARAVIAHHTGAKK